MAKEIIAQVNETLPEEHALELWIRNEKARQAVKESDFVCIQSPPAGRKIDPADPKQRRIELFRIMAPVPDVRQEMSLAEAAEHLSQEEGFIVPSSRRYSDRFQVTHQSPEPHGRFANRNYAVRGETVFQVYSKVFVEDWQRQAADQANTYMQGLQRDGSIEYHAPPGVTAEYKVVSQSHKGWVDRGTRIWLRTTCPPKPDQSTLAPSIHVVPSIPVAPYIPSPPPAVGRFQGGGAGFSGGFPGGPGGMTGGMGGGFF
jgi:hypothetical protein